MNKCLSIASGCFFFLFLFFVKECIRKPHIKSPSYLGPARHKPLIFWKSTAVIGWPRGSQVITLTVDSVAGGGRRGRRRRRIETTNKVSQKILEIQFGGGRKLVLLFPDTAAKRGAETVLGTNETFVWSNCIFFFEISVGCYPSTPIAVYFHFQLRKEISKFLHHHGLLPTRGKTASSDCFWDFFFSPLICSRHRLWFHANQFDCVCSIDNFFLASHTILCNHVVIFADQYVPTCIDALMFLSPPFFLSSLKRKKKIGLLSL